MAFKKTLVQRLFNLSRFSTPSLSRTPAGKPERVRPALAPDPGEAGGMKRAVQRRPLYQSATTGLQLFPPGGENLVEKLRGMDIAKDRIRLDGLLPFPAARGRDEEVVTVREVRKVVRASQAEAIKARLAEITGDWISYSEYVKICGECCGGNIEQGLEFAKMLDECGCVIVLGNTVCLRPHQEIKTLVANAIQSLITPPLSDLGREELKEMEKQKADIDQKADALVRRELWAGLGFLVAQTVTFMRLTFWELSWDVMEPICFYVTSAYFMGCYAFFLRTSKEPSFEGFFQSRFSVKQKRLMKAHNFDLNRYNELRKAFYGSTIASSSTIDDSKVMAKFSDHYINK